MYNKNTHNGICIYRYIHMYHKYLSIRQEQEADSPEYCCLTGKGRLYT